MANVLATAFGLLVAFACLLAAQWFLSGLFKTKIPKYFVNALGLLAIILTIFAVLYILTLNDHAAELFYWLGLCFRTTGNLLSDLADGLYHFGTYLIEKS